MPGSILRVYFLHSIISALWHSSIAYHKEKLICHLQCYQSSAVSAVSCGLGESLWTSGGSFPGLPPKGRGQQQQLPLSISKGAFRTSRPHDSPAQAASPFSYCRSVHLPTPSPQQNVNACRYIQGCTSLGRCLINVFRSIGTLAFLPVEWTQYLLPLHYAHEKEITEILEILESNIPEV